MSYLLETLGRGWIGHLSDAFEQRMRVELADHPH
jgi:hypothetical protein